jgi:hypothetical protein
MTRRELRDHFAGLAMQGLIPQYREMFMDGTLEDWVSDALPALADEAFLLANEMLRAGGYHHD